MANEKFDLSDLKPWNPKKSGWDASQLKPVKKEDYYDKLYAEPESTKDTGASGILEDIAGIPEKIGNYALDLPGKAAEGWEQIFTNPSRAAKNVAAGAGETAIGAFNLPHSLADYLKSKNVPWFKQIADYVPHIGDLGVEKKLGLDDKQSGDEILRQMFDFAIPGKVAKEIPAVENIAERVSEAGKYGKLKKHLEGLENKIEEKGTSTGQLSNIENEAKAEADKLQSQANKDIGEHLNEGAAHGARGASALSHRIGNIEKYWSQTYKDLKTNLKDSEFKMDKLPDYANDMEHAIKNIKDLEVVNGKFVIKGQPEISAELQNLMDKAPTPKDTSAEDFLTKYQSFRQNRYDLLQRIKSEKDSAIRKQLYKAYEDSKPIETSISKALEEGLGEHSPEFKRINEGFSTQIYPIRGNKIAKQALKGKLGPNVMENLEGFGEGQEQLRELIKQDPELLRNIVGQRYSAKPEKLHDLNETTSEYLAEMPELRKLMDEHKSNIESKLSEVNKHKQAKDISLQQKIKLEKEASELKDRLSRIEKDRKSIMKWGKRAGYTVAALTFGAPVVGNKIKQIRGD